MIATVAGTLLVLLAAEPGVTLRGSPASMVRQNEVAREHSYTFLRDPAQVEEFVAKGLLVPVQGTTAYEVDNDVSFPFARPEVHTFVHRLSVQYQAACGEQLVVTSLTRPQSTQPRNAHNLSVHPTGMAVDFRVPQNQACRDWLEATLLALEEQKMLDVTRERRPPHYHVAIFPDLYAAHVARLLQDSLGALPAATTVGSRGWFGRRGTAGAASAEERGNGSALATVVLLLLVFLLAAGAAWWLRQVRNEASDHAAGAD